MARKPASFSIASHIAERKAELRDARARIKRIENNAGLLKLGFAMVEEVAKRAKLHDAFAWPNAYVWAYDAGGAELSASFEVPCTSLKDGPLPDILSKALVLGFEATGSDDAVGELYAERKYRFTKRLSDDVVVKLTIRAAIRDADGATCRKVQVGTKLEEVAQYQLVCE
jgi:hypothetical protein